MNKFSTALLPSKFLKWNQFKTRKTISPSGLVHKSEGSELFTPLTRATSKTFFSTSLSTPVSFPNGSSFSLIQPNELNAALSGVSSRWSLSSSLVSKHYIRRNFASKKARKSRGQDEIHISCTTLQDTEALGAIISKECEKGDLILLIGGLGAGKTSFVRGLINEKISHTEEKVEVTSPTFILENIYTIPKTTPPLKIHHLDLYRLQKPEELSVLNLPGTFKDGITLVEWPQLLLSESFKSLPKDYLIIEIDYEEYTSDPTQQSSDELSETTDHRDPRIFILTPFGKWKQKLALMFDENQQLKAANKQSI